VRRPAVGLRIDGRKRADARRGPSEASPASSGRHAAAGATEGGVKLVRLKLSCRSQQPRREAAGRELSGNGCRPVKRQRIVASVRRQIPAHAGRIGGAHEREANY